MLTTMLNSHQKSTVDSFVSLIAHLVNSYVHKNVHNSSVSWVFSISISMTVCMCGVLMIWSISLNLYFFLLSITITTEMEQVKKKTNVGII